MAEFIGGKGLDLTRAALKQYYATQHRMYKWFSARAWDVCSIHDDFQGPVIDTNRWTVGNGGGAGVASPAVSVGLVNGQITMVTGTANDNTASSTLKGGRHFYGQNNAIILARIAIVSVVTGVKVEIGFSDAITTAAADHAVVATKATPTFTGTDGVVWILDTTDNVYWEGVAVANTVAAVTVEAAISPVASTFEYLQVALVGTVAFFSRFDAAGRRTYGPVAQAAAVTANVLLAPHVTIEARDATSKDLRVDALWVYQGRTTD